MCDDNWDIKDANVVCRMLNLGNATAFFKSAAFGQGTGLTLLDDVDCIGMIILSNFRSEATLIS